MLPMRQSWTICKFQKDDNYAEQDYASFFIACNVEPCIEVWRNNDLDRRVFEQNV
jgi:hypothetical protein